MWRRGFTVAMWEGTGRGRDRHQCPRLGCLVAKGEREGKQLQQPEGPKIQRGQVTKMVGLYREEQPWRVQG